MNEAQKSTIVLGFYGLLLVAYAIFYTLYLRPLFNSFEPDLQTIFFLNLLLLSVLLSCFFLYGLYAHFVRQQYETAVKLSAWGIGILVFPPLFMALLRYFFA